MHALRDTALLLVLLVVSGCGYSFVDPRATFGPGEHAIAIEMFQNRTAQPGFEQLLADAFQEEFSRRGALAVAYGRGPGVDLVLDGVVKEVGVLSSAVSSVGLTLEDEVSVVVELAIRRSADESLVLHHDGLRYRERFLASADPGVYESNKEEALRRLSSAIASRINDELVQAY